MTIILSETAKIVWDYICKLPHDELGFDNTIQIDYKEHCPILKMDEFDLRDALDELEKKYLVKLVKYDDGRIVTLLK